MEESHEDAQFVEFIVKAIVDNPQDVKVERTVDEMGVLCTLHVNPADLGQVIGRQGQTAKSIRTLLRVVGAKNHARVNMKIYEPEGYRKFKGELGGKPMTDQPHQAAPQAPQPSGDLADDLKL
ncbi:MAG: KH domain-containing protein [Patescibacteria group bacterium]